jgi:CBS domain-containing protein
MPRSVNEVMTHDPRTVAPGDPLAAAAAQMRDGDVGVLVLVDEGSVAGVITDRDIVVRAVADGRDPGTTTVGDIASRSVVTLGLDASVEEAARLMREHDVRRIPVVQGDRVVGIVSIGDLAVELDEGSALADISAATPNN